MDNFVHGDLHPGNLLVQNAKYFVPQVSISVAVDSIVRDRLLCAEYLCVYNSYSSWNIHMIQEHEEKYCGI